MNFAIMGTGSIAGEHAKTMHILRGRSEWRDLRMTHVIGRERAATDAFATEHEIDNATCEFEEVLANPAIDALIITTPTDQHAGQSKRALLAGKHVLCEIPLATSLAETDELIAIADSMDRRLMVCHTQRFFAPLMEARRMINDGEIHLHMIVSRYLFNRRNTINWKGRNRSWVDNLVWHHAGHSVDATLWLMGASSVEATSQLAPADPVMGIPMDLSVTMRDLRGVIATVVNSYHALLPQHDYLMIGNETSLHFIEGELRSPERLIVPSTGTDPLPDAMSRQNAEFLSSVREGRAPSVSGQSVRLSMAVLQSIQDRTPFAPGD